MNTPKEGEKARDHGASNGCVLQVRNEDPSKVQPWRAWLPKLKDAIPCTEKPCIDWKPDLKHESAEPWADWMKSAGLPGAENIVLCEKGPKNESAEPWTDWMKSAGLPGAIDIVLCNMGPKN